MKSRWVFALDRTPAVSIGWVSGKLTRRSALAIARILSGHHRAAVRLYRVRGPASRIRGVIGYPVANPTLVHHGLARAARWHVLTANMHTAVADLYNLSSAQARRVAQTIANAIGVPVIVADNRSTTYLSGQSPRDIGGHELLASRQQPGGIAYRPRRKNPKPAPVIGQWWREFHTGRIGTITSIGPTTIAMLDRNGKRFSVDRLEFRDTWKPYRPTVIARNRRKRANRRNPGARDARTEFSKGDHVSISAIRYFGRHGIVEKVTKRFVWVRDNLSDRLVKFHPDHLRITNRRRNPGRALTVPEKHQLKIARATLKMNDTMARIMGGPTKAEAREIIARLTGKRPRNPRRSAKKKTRGTTSSSARARRSRGGMNSRRRGARSRSRDHRGRFRRFSRSSAASSRSFTRATSMTAV